MKSLSLDIGRIFGMLYWAGNYCSKLEQQENDVTTIAWDGKTLAGDSQSTNGGLPRTFTKLWKLASGDFFGACGDAQDCIAVKDWLNSLKEKESPKVADSFGALLIKVQKSIVVYPDKPEVTTVTTTVYKLEDKLIEIPVKEKQTAIGSGRDFAIAAMRLNCDAAVAVSIASEFDVYTGGLIDVLSIE